MFVKPAAPRPISAGIQPEFDRISSTASTLKFENVAPPISGSELSAPSIANTASTPRWPLIANCCVKLVAPFASVIVPAAKRSNWLKSRLFNGSSDTVRLDNCSPPELRDSAGDDLTAKTFRSEIVTSTLVPWSLYRQARHLRSHVLSIEWKACNGVAEDLQSETSRPFPSST